MKNNNKNKAIIIIVSILVILLICLIAFLLIVKINGSLNNNKTSNTTTKEKEELSLDPEIYSSVLLASLRTYNNCNTGYTFDFTSKDKIEYKDLNKDFIYNTVYNYLNIQKRIEKNQNKNDNNDAVLSETNFVEETFSLNDFLLAYQTLYGIESKNIKYDNSFNIGDYKFELNSQNNYYTKKISSPNCMVNNVEKYVLTDQSSTKDKIALTYILYYSIYEFENNELNEYATNKKDGTKICNAYLVNNEDNNTKFTKYKFNFVRKDQSYIFDNVALAK